MVTAAADDPIRAEVERRLHLVVDVTLAVPRALVGGTRTCVARHVGAMCERVTRPVRMARSLIDLAGGPRPADDGVVPSAATARVVERPVEPAPARSRDDHVPPVDSATDLPIEEYESLAASQVVARLPSLTVDELDAVRRFETDHRGRRTVLGRIDQLLAPA